MVTWLGGAYSRGANSRIYGTTVNLYGSTVKYLKYFEKATESACEEKDIAPRQVGFFVRYI